MFRKILASVLCLMLALAMPLSSLAATDITLRIIPGTEMAAADESINSVFDNLFLHFVLGEKSGLMAVESAQGEIVSASLRDDGTGLYVGSPLLGNRILYFTNEDLAAFMTEMMKQSGMSAEELAEFEQAMSQMTSQSSAMAMAEFYDETDVDLTTYTDPATIPYDKIFADDPAMLQYIENMLAKMVVTEGDFTDAAHNPATTKTEMTMTSEDMAFIFDSKMAKELYGSMAQSAGMNADEFTATVKDVYSQLNPVINMTYLSNGDELCAMEMDMIMKGDVTLEQTDANGNTTSETASIDITMDITANVLTEGEVDTMKILMNMNITEEGETSTLAYAIDVTVDDENDVYTLTGNMTIDEESLMSFQGALAEGEDDAVKGWLAFLSDNAQMTLTLEGAEKNDVYDALLSIYFREEATAITEPTWSDSALISFAAQVKDVETPDTLKQLEAATPETSVQLLRMTQDELEAEINALSGDAMGALFTGLGNLPSELLELVMTSMELVPQQ